MLYRDAKRQLESFEDFIFINNVLPLTVNSVNASSEIYNDLRTDGKLLDDIDILIAGVAISFGLVLVTANEKHFERIINLEIENWSKRTK